MGPQVMDGEGKGLVRGRVDRSGPDSGPTEECGSGCPDSGNRRGLAVVVQGARFALVTRDSSDSAGYWDGRPSRTLLASGVLSDLSAITAPSGGASTIGSHRGHPM